MLKNGEVYDAYALNNRTPPEHFHPPKVIEGFESWVGAFWELSTDRQLGFGHYGPIPNSSISQYTKDWPRDEAELFRQCIRAMDRVFLAKGEDITPVVLPEEPTADPGGISNPARDNFRATFKR